LPYVVKSDLKSSAVYKPTHVVRLTFY